MTAILGISAFYHDSAAALVIDGEIVAAAQEERFTRKKHDAGFPQHAMDYCLAVADIPASQLDYVVFYDKPVRKFERLLETYLAYAPRGFRAFRQAMPVWLKEKLFLPRTLDAGLRKQYRGRYVFLDHHESHAASAFFPSPFDQAAIITFDGVGEWSTSCLGVGEGSRITLRHEQRFPHSLGLLYSAFTYYCGFRVNSGEYKLMGLAPYGEPRFREPILDHLLDLKSDGSFRMDMNYFNYCQGLTMTSSKFHQLFGGSPRSPESELTQRDMDLAASVQSVTEEIMLRTANFWQQETGQNHCVLAGGVALNCVGNGRILRESTFDQVWVQPAAGDAGGALGAALFVWHQLLERPREVQQPDAQRGSLLGPAYDTEDIRRFCANAKGLHRTHEPSVGAALATARYPTETTEPQDPPVASVTEAPDWETLYRIVAQHLAAGQVVGWFQGRMEFGPRALGARSILGDARKPQMQATMNRKIKFRESFRPFAPVVLQDYVSDYFEMRAGEDSPYMVMVAPIQESQRKQVDDTRVGLDRLSQCRSSIPAVTHVDYSARVQTVDPMRNPVFHGLLSEFHRQTGCPVLINTSFNVRGEPIVCTPEHAYRCFLVTEMDVLVMDRFVLTKSQDSTPSAAARAKHLSQFPLD